jgi:hypothetical protein
VESGRVARDRDGSCTGVVVAAQTQQAAPALMRPADIGKLPMPPADHNDSLRAGCQSGWRTAAAPGPHPVIVLVHGGCWMPQAARYLAAMGDELKKDGIGQLEHRVPAHRSAGRRLAGHLPRRRARHRLHPGPCGAVQAGRRSGRINLILISAPSVIGNNSRNSITDHRPRRVIDETN